jgi:hypothetical protein
MTGTSSENLLLEVTVKIKQPTDDGMKEVLATEYKITKPDAGRASENWISISIEPGTSGNYSDARIAVTEHSKDSASTT